ncbi:FAD-dependent oxidoreductase [Anabaena sp. FACHB-1237]|uniref:FAD-dependent oxidoreductase n=1 Tax=Anabaena sp. FACHB-1237 TaxID=2692769 RepID=UPI001681A365|nr:FAD-dependent oxidoreductase [Anabaena sp. FACHB-1237]MBD2136827.1 FAD-dependent oxidoreductase [Anabaena sp. FACHB-1237]
MTKQTYTTDILIVGGGTGGTAAAIQAARRGIKTILVSEFSWLGGMLTSAGVSAPDGNELEAFQTGLWGDFIQELQRRQPGGLDHSWVSFFSYHPRIGAEIFADWVKKLSYLTWITGKVPLEVLREQDKITGVRFADLTIHAKIIIDGTELGDLLALAEVPYRWGWELKSQWGEPSAPEDFNTLTQTYPVQSPTWVVVMEDFNNTSQTPPEISPAPNYDPSLFKGAWDNYGAETFLNYGRLPENKFMINWPICGNDYCQNVNRLLQSETQRREFLQECFWHSQNFAHFIQSNIPSHLGRRYGLATGTFPTPASAFALHPYFRESRRLVGLTTIREQDILPSKNGSHLSSFHDTIAIGNYANDHHYPGVQFPLKPKSIRWGGRWTGTPFTIPYRSLVPVSVDGLLVCEKNISVSHIANGATRLQPVVMGIGQAAGMAAALCIELECQPRELPVRTLQTALLNNDYSPTAIVPLFNLPINHPDWKYWQNYYLDNPQAYPASGVCPGVLWDKNEKFNNRSNLDCLIGIFQKSDQQNYQFYITENTDLESKLVDNLPDNQNNKWQLVTRRSLIDQQLQNCTSGEKIKIWCRINFSGKWLIVEHLEKLSN